MTTSLGNSSSSAAKACADEKAAHMRRASLDSCDFASGGGGATAAAASLVGETTLLLKCRYPKCETRAPPAEAKRLFKSCHNCQHLYCSRECRRAHWEHHRKACLHSRVSALCRQVLATCKDEPDSLRNLSMLAKRGYLSQGRGVVRILFRSPESAEQFIRRGYQQLGESSYVRWPDLLPAEMGPELYAELLRLSTEYKPDSKMLVYVAICVVSEAPSGRNSAPVKWERQLVSRCAKLKLCKSALHELAHCKPNFPTANDQGVMAGAGTAEGTADAMPDILILTFNVTTTSTSSSSQQRSSMAQEVRDTIFRNVQQILAQRGVVLRRHYPEVYQRLNTFAEGITDRFIPVTLHPKDSNTGRPFVCIIMPNTEGSETLKMPKTDDSGGSVRVLDVSVENLEV